MSSIVKSHKVKENMKNFKMFSKFIRNILTLKKIATFIKIYNHEK